MKIFVDLSPTEKYALSKMTPTHVETHLTVYSEEGVCDVRNKIHKQCLTQEVDAVQVVVGDRTCTIDNCEWTPKEMWQIPFPNVTRQKVVHTHNLTDGMCCVVEYDPDATYFFTGATAEKVVAFLETLEQKM
jgi:hypothetical protein